MRTYISGILTILFIFSTVFLISCSDDSTEQQSVKGTIKIEKLGD